jgi:hypothetical protein
VKKFLKTFGYGFMRNKLFRHSKTTVNIQNIEAIAILLLAADGGDSSSGQDQRVARHPSPMNSIPFIAAAMAIKSG